MSTINNKRKQLQNLRIWNRADKLSYIDSYIDSTTEQMLEMGPSISPIWSVEKYKNVRYLESCDSEGLDERAKSKGTTNPIRKVHYVFDPNQGFKSSIENSNGYKYVSSSHVIEHIPDFIAHLKGVEDITDDQGYYFCIAPDKNLIFDKQRPTSSLGDMVSHHIEQRSSLGAAIDAIFYSVEIEESGRGWWNSNDNSIINRRNDISTLKALSPRQLKNGHFKNWFGHYHVFDPMSFSELITGLREMKFISLSLCDLVSTGHMDFLAILKNDNGASNMTLKQIQKRLSEQNYPFITNKAFD